MALGVGVGGQRGLSEALPVRPTQTPSSGPTFSQIKKTRAHVFYLRTNNGIPTSREGLPQRSQLCKARAATARAAGPSLAGSVLLSSGQGTPAGNPVTRAT